jgi:GNAT superfamily N-acetyltransferase
LVKGAEPRGDQVSVVEFAPAEHLPADQRAAVVELFDRVYFEYFDRDAVGAPGGTRFMAVAGRRIVGFAAYVRYGRYAYLMNLAVDPEFRGSWTAIALEQARRHRVQEAGLLGYGTCVCDNLTGQTFRLVVGFQAVNVRYGYGMRASGRHSSVLTVAEGAAVPEAVPGPAVRENRVKGRIRFLADAPAHLARLPDPSDTRYVDVLTSPDLANELDGDDRFSYSGIDLDLQRQTWHHCFQLVNGRHRRGLAAGPLLVSHWPKRRDELRAMSMACLDRRLCGFTQVLGASSGRGIQGGLSGSPQ